MPLKLSTLLQVEHGAHTPITVDLRGIEVQYKVGSRSLSWTSAPPKFPGILSLDRCFGYSYQADPVLALPQNLGPYRREICHICQIIRGHLQVKDPGSAPSTPYSVGPGAAAGWGWGRSKQDRDLRTSSWKWYPPLCLRMQMDALKMFRLL